MTPPLTTTLDELERLLAAATQEPELDNQSEVGSDLPWGPPVQGPIAWIIREHGNGAQIGNFLLHADAALAVAAVNVLPALIAAAKENLRPRWHHDWDLPPEDRHYCEECSALITEVRQLRAAQPAPPAEALWLLRELVDEMENCRVAADAAVARAGSAAAAFEERVMDVLPLGRLNAIEDEARRYLAATEEGTP